MEVQNLKYRSENPRLDFLLLIRTCMLELTNNSQSPNQEVWSFWVLLGFSSGTESVGDWFQVFIATVTCPPHITVPEKKRKLLACLLALLRKSWMKCWIDEFIKLVLSFLQNRGARLASSFCRTQSNESATHVKLLFLWDGWVASDTLCIFVSWQLQNISWQQVVVD